LRAEADHHRYPKKREIRDKMYAQKYETTSKTYLQEIRKAAMIEYR